MTRKSSTEAIVAAMRILARDIQSGDCVANAAISEAAARLEELHADHLRDATKMAELEARIAELEAQAAIGRRAVVSGLAVGEPFAWATFDGEGGYDLRLYEGNESYRDDWQAVNRRFRDWVIPLYCAEPEPATVAVDAVALDRLRVTVDAYDKALADDMPQRQKIAALQMAEAARHLLEGGE